MADAYFCIGPSPCVFFVSEVNPSFPYVTWPSKCFTCACGSGFMEKGTPHIPINGHCQVGEGVGA